MDRVFVYDCGQSNQNCETHFLCRVCVCLYHFVSLIIVCIESEYQTKKPKQTENIYLFSHGITRKVEIGEENNICDLF